MRKRLDQFSEYLRSEIWHHTAYSENSISKPSPYILALRILSLALDGLRENQLFSRAAALSYSTLLGLGPMIFIVVMISGTYMKTNAESLIKSALLFAAPTLQDYQSDGVEESSQLDGLIQTIVGGAESTLSRINTAGGSAAGLVGAILLVSVAIQLLTSIERTLNSIWGVKRGRGWVHRIVFYWTFLSLGVLLGFGSTAMFSVSTLTSVFDWFPFGTTLTALFIALTPFISLCMLVLLLSISYQFFPNTAVRFKPALMGATFAALLLVLNNYISIIYVHQVLRMQSLYGSLGILLVMMFGLYFFWIILLLGAQVTFAIQNVEFLARRAVWHQVSVQAQETVTLATMLTISRRFADCEPAPDAEFLSQHLKVPHNVLNTAIGLLTDKNWITPIRQNDEDGMEETVYRPSCPLHTYSLGRFYRTFHTHGDQGAVESMIRIDPILRHYQQEQNRITGDSELMTRNFENLLDPQK